ncbi:hypothetical protein [Amycolatopsis panacis]|uniref:hypothetical protein n=1 Tax=Amycolatopsis panacis TaxID=2340917 RepID=UPI001F46DF6F|nr:hypothetical protein [Amycolatopsis panacis]
MSHDRKAARRGRRSSGGSAGSTKTRRARRSTTTAGRPTRCALALWLLTEGMPALLPGGEALVVDVRRAKEFTLPTSAPQRLRPWAFSEASAFLTLWYAA